MALSAVPLEALALVQEPASHSLSLQTLPVPTAKNNEEHLIRVHAVALTNGELAWKETLTVDYPIPGYEVAGIVETAPPGSRFPPGTAVYARTGFDRAGSARPYSIALMSELGHKPSNLSWQEAATVPLSALSAWQALFVHGELLEPGQPDAQARNAGSRVLVTAAAGGVGLWTVQLAKLAGAYVVGTCGPSNQKFVTDLGADEVLDYTQTSLPAWISAGGHRPFDLVIDCAGGAALEEAWQCAGAEGLVISLALPADIKRPAEGVADGVRSKWFVVDANGNQLDGITKLLEEEKVRAVFDSVFSLADFQKAFDKVYSGHVTGKVVLDIVGNGQ